MSHGGDLRPGMDEPMDAFGLPATVDVAGADPVETTAFWLPPVTEGAPLGAVYTKPEPIDVLVLRRDEVPRVPVGAFVDVALIDGAEIERWQIDGFLEGDAQHHRCIMRRWTPERQEDCA